MPIYPDRIQALCFDVDGTLSDTDDLYVEKLSRILKPFHFFFPGQDTTKLARRIIMTVEAPGNFLIGLPDKIGLDDEIYALVDALARHSHPKPRQHRVVPGVREMLMELKPHYPLAVVSARDERTTHMFLDDSGLTSFFTCIATAQTCQHTKPFPDPVLWAARQMNVSPESCLMVGDTTVDIQAGHSAGAQTAGVLCGFGEQDELMRKGAGVILPTTAALLETLALAGCNQQAG
jgi:HAD superfamily hydrolase (TIGR01662 family)